MRSLLFLLGTATLFACSPVTEPNSGEAIDGGAVQIDATVDCNESADCGGGLTPICDDVSSTCQACAESTECVALGGPAECSSSGACVECTEDTHCSIPTAPLCGEDETCRGCESNDECDSGACNFGTGACVEGSNIAYVNGNGGVNAGTCTQSQPCLTIAYGIGRLSDTRGTLVVAPGTYSERITPSNSFDIRIIGYGATIDGEGVVINQSDDGLVEIGSNVKVVMEGLEIINSQKQGLHCRGTLSNPAQTSISLYDVTIKDSAESGIANGNSCDAFLHRITVTGNGHGAGAAAITWLQAELRIDSSNIFANPSTALATDDAKVTLLNSLITNNGSENYDRIITIRGDGTQPVVMRYNTIVANAPGCVPTVQYATTDQPVTFDSNIVFSNIVTCSGNIDPNASAPDNNIIEDVGGSGPAVPAGNFTDDPRFVNAGAGDYRLQMMSVGVDKGLATNAPDHDFNGDPRPLGIAPDIGAFESF